MRKILFCLVIIFACLFPKVSIAHDEETIEILMYEDHYEPRDIEIKQGDTISFVNVSEISHWPASNIHPTHEIYPEFDPKRDLQKGETWSFQFNKEGEW